MTRYSLRVKCHGTDKGETWSVQLLHDDAVVAIVGELASPGDARQAGEYLLFGALNGWKPNLVQSDDMRAGIEALNAPAEELMLEHDGSDVDLMRVGDIVRDVWNACVRRLRAEAEQACPGA